MFGKVKVFLPVGWVVLTNVAFAASDPFETSTAKIKELSGYMSGDFAMAVCGFVVVGAGALLLFGKLRLELALKIMGGAVLMGCAEKVSSFFFGN